MIREEKQIVILKHSLLFLLEITTIFAILWDRVRKPCLFPFDSKQFVKLFISNAVVSLYFPTHVLLKAHCLVQHILSLELLIVDGSNDAYSCAKVKVREVTILWAEVTSREVRSIVDLACLKQKMFFI